MIFFFCFFLFFNSKMLTLYNIYCDQLTLKEALRFYKLKSEIKTYAAVLQFYPISTYVAV